jgi:hypothetical protein
MKRNNFLEVIEEFKRGGSPSFLKQIPPLLEKERGTGGEVEKRCLPMLFLPTHPPTKASVLKGVRLTSLISFVL